MSIGDFPESLSQAMLVGCNVSRRIGRIPLKKKAQHTDCRSNAGLTGVFVCSRNYLDCLKRLQIETLVNPTYEYCIQRNLLVYCLSLYVLCLFVVLLSVSFTLCS